MTTLYNVAKIIIIKTGQGILGAAPVTQLLIVKHIWHASTSFFFCLFVCLRKCRYL